MISIIYFNYLKYIPLVCNLFIAFPLMNYKLLAAVIALSLASLYFTVINVQSDLYLEWKKTYGYQWDHQQDQYRRIIFLKNL